ncbi:hypothetical protein V8B97DRAFT_2006761 [Scleroderma yunnanense]
METAGTIQLEFESNACSEMILPTFFKASSPHLQAYIYGHIPVPTHSPDDRPSGKNKKEVTAAIAKHIFEHNPIYGTLYASDPSKFTTSVTNQLAILKNKYCEQHAQFSSTGSDVAPDANVLHIFLYYSELDLIWHGIPSVDSELILSHPNTKHTENFLDLVKTRSTQGDGTEDQGNVDVEEGNIVAGEDEAIHNATVAVDGENNSTMDFEVGNRGAFDDGNSGGTDAMDEGEDGVMETGVLEYQNKELDLQCKKLNTQHANADIALCWEHNLKKLDIKLKKAEESMLSQQIELIHLQIALKGMEHPSASSTGPSSR